MKLCATACFLFLRITRSWVSLPPIPKDISSTNVCGERLLALIPCDSFRNPQYTPNTGQPMNNRVALVTGAGSGIGRATAIAFAREGAQVVISDRDEQSGYETVDMIHEIDGDAFF